VVTHHSGHAPKSGPDIKGGRSRDKNGMESSEKDPAYVVCRHCKKISFILFCISKKIKEDYDCGSEGGSFHSERVAKDNYSGEI